MKEEKKEAVGNLGITFALLAIGASLYVVYPLTPR